MILSCYGISHHEAPVEVRERFALGENASVEAGRALCSPGRADEVVVLSTCNRTEYYSVAPRAARELVEADVCGAVPLAGFLHHEGEAAVRHLFRVACGLDSMVLGETEILGQVKKAYQNASLGGTTSRFLNKLFQRSFQVAKHVRSRTAITRGSVSVGSIAVDLAEQIFGSLRDRKVMIVGAGDTGELTARTLRSRGVQSLFVANRSFERADALARELGGRALHFDAWEQEMRDVDILLSSTSAPHFVITRSKLEPVMEERPERPLFLIDLAVPRDIEPSVNELDGVYLYDIDALQGIAAGALERRRAELAECERLIDEHVADFMGWLARETPRVGWERFLQRHRAAQLTKLNSA